MKHLRTAAPAALAALACGVLGVFLAAHHPLSAGWALLAFGLACLAFARWPDLWQFAIPAMLPLLDFSPWTGWLLVNEFDMAVLAALVSGLGRLAWQRGRGEPAPDRLPPALAVVALLLALDGVAAVLRGVWDAGGWGPLGPGAWFQGYGEPLNALRVTKSSWEALLFVPLLHEALWRDKPGTVTRIGWGVFAGLAGVALAVLWERLAFPGLLDFSVRYRTVGLFWEMHVGGAAIDGFLALAAPFAVWALHRSRRPLVWAAAASVTLLAVYACLTSFSRGVYLAVGGPLLLLSVLLRAQKIGFDVRRLALRLLRSLLWVAGLWALLALAFEAGAYAGAGAMLATLVVVLWLAGRRRRSAGWRREASWTLALAALIEVVVVLNGGSFMAERVSATDRDFGRRLDHWQRGLSLLRTPADTWLGLGAGRLPSRYAAIGNLTQWSGQLRWQPPTADAPAHVALSGPRSMRRLGGLFALTQRVPVDVEQAYTVRAQVRAAAANTLYVSLCERHLLYDGRCREAFLPVQARPGVWQVVEGPLKLSADDHDDAPGYAPRLGMLGLSAPVPGRGIDIARVELANAQGGVPLHNPAFADALAHWLPAAQYYFLPWHIDNLYLELLIERGGIGLALHASLLLFTLWHLVGGRARSLEAAPYLAASLVGAALVGAFSSLLDMPRIAFLLYWLLFASLLLAGPATGPPTGKRG